MKNAIRQVGKRSDKKTSHKKEVPKDDHKAVAHFLYEVGTLRKVARAHRQTLLEDDLSDNIASHSYRVAMIGWFLAKMEGADPYKVMMMGLLHDVAETRSNDHNWVHKKYIKIFEDEIIKDQFKSLPESSELTEVVQEYGERTTLEAKVAKDADFIDQLLLLKEYEHKGNKEAAEWVASRRNDAYVVTKSAQSLAVEIIRQTPSDWWRDAWTNKNR